MNICSPYFFIKKGSPVRPLRQTCECRCPRLVSAVPRHCLRPQMSERLLDVENEAMLKIVELEKQLMQTNKELDHIRVRSQKNIFFSIIEAMKDK